MAIRVFALPECSRIVQKEILKKIIKIHFQKVCPYNITDAIDSLRNMNLKDFRL